jgi:hypothetical protein
MVSEMMRVEKTVAASSDLRLIRQLPARGMLTEEQLRELDLDVQRAPTPAGCGSRPRAPSGL